MIYRAKLLAILSLVQIQAFSSAFMTQSLRRLQHHEKVTLFAKHELNKEEIDGVIGAGRRSILASTIPISFLLGSSTLLLPFPSTSSTAASAAVSSTATKTTKKIPEWTLQGNGVLPGHKVSFPTLALNTVGLSVEDTARAVELARQAGISHIDFHPGKERDGVAQYLLRHKSNTKASNGSSKRNDDLFLNTKIRKAPPGTSPVDAAEMTRIQIQEDLTALGVDQVDMLMLRDSPDCEVIQAQWAVLEDALRSGKTRSIGVINFCEKALTCLLQSAKVKPAVNYFMLHVGMGENPRGLRTFGESRGIRTFGYGAVGEPGPSQELLSSPTVQTIGRSHDNRTPEEVALRWVIQSGAAVSVRPTLDFGLGTSTCGDGSKCQDGIHARANAFEWTLTREEMKTLSQMTSPNDNPTLFSSTGCPDAYVMPKK